MDNALAGLPPELKRGLIYTHNRANANTAAAHEANAALDALAEMPDINGRERAKVREILARERLAKQ